MARPRTRPRYLGVVVWLDRSLLDGAPIVVVATGYQTQRTMQNTKLGDAIQLWILREDLDPLAAVQQRRDGSVCGDCELRGDPAADVPRGCYVPVQWYPRKVWLTYQAGRYTWIDQVEERGDRDPFAGRVVRIGSYGDPAAVPTWVWETLRDGARSTLAYTRQWRAPGTDPELRRHAMASVFTPAERREARALGYRTYRGIPCSREQEHDLAFLRSQLQPGEILCPHVSHGVTCAKCRLCDGARDGDPRADIAAPVHGKSGVRSGYATVVEQLERGHPRLRVVA